MKKIVLVLVFCILVVLVFQFFPVTTHAASDAGVHPLFTTIEPCTTEAKPFVIGKPVSGGEAYYCYGVQIGPGSTIITVNRSPINYMDVGRYYGWFTCIAITCTFGQRIHFATDTTTPPGTFAVVKIDQLCLSLTSSGC
ncbi:MAG TPA: hypothetical protein VFN35_30125 [Ktedonobacteraceae bacterium]|nr:hypothetical protein [Ktedonobacteraceae bacterium]